MQDEFDNWIPEDSKVTNSCVLCVISFCRLEMLFMEDH